MGKETYIRPMETSSVDDHVRWEKNLHSRSTLWDALRAMVQIDTRLGKFVGIATKPPCPTISDHGQHFVIAHGRFSEETLFGRREVLKIPVEKYAQEGLGDP